MIRELEDQLVKRYPTIFQDIGGDLTKTCMAFGICCNEGWYMLIYQMCAEIMELPGHEDFKAKQVKEKSGGLRFYYSGGNEAISKLVNTAEDKSYTICEHCGVTTGVTCRGCYWVRALCDVCRPIYDGAPWSRRDW